MASSRIGKNVSLTPQLSKFVEQLVRSGRYQSSSEVHRAALRLLAEAERARKAEIASIRKKIDEGWAAARRGEFVDGEEYFREAAKRARPARRKAG